MLRTLKRLRSSVVIPMHWFGEATLARFLQGIGGDFRIERPGVSEVVVGLRTLPDLPTVMVLDPRYLQE